MPSKNFRNQEPGMGLSEILIVIALLGIIAAISIPRMMQGGNEKKLRTQEKNAVSTLQSSIAVENANMGLLPQQMGPGKVFKTKLKAKDLQTVSLNSNQCNNPPINRPIGNHGYQLPDGTVVVTDDTWDNYNYRPGSTKTMGRQACLLLKGLNSDPAKGEISYITFYRDGQADASLASNGTTDSEDLNGNNVNNVTNTPVDPLDGIDPNDPPIATCDPNKKIKAEQLLAKYADLKYHMQFFLDHPVNPNSNSAGWRWTFILNDVFDPINADWYPSIPNVGANWGAKPYGGSTVYWSHQFTSKQMAENNYLKGGGIAYVSDDELAALEGAYPGLGYLMKNEWENEWMQAHYTIGSVLNEIRKVQVCPEDTVTQAKLDAFKDLLEENAINGTYSSPIKINLKGQDAQVNSDGDFLFATVGFRTKGRNLVVKTAGGLNPDEAWLVADRGHLGFISKNGILDGQDVFGDHLGTFPSGYEDLAARYKKFVVKDSHGKHFIPLHQLNWWESFWIWLMHFLGFDHTPNPSYELKLLPKNYHAILASSVLEAVYVDYQNVDELDADKQNWVRQRGVVVYRDGHKATGVDQWFQVKLMKTQPEL